MPQRAYRNPRLRNLLWLRLNPAQARAFSTSALKIMGDAMRPTKLHFRHDRPRERDRQFWDRQLRAQIGRDLRVVFEATLREPLPERVSRVLGQIEEGRTVSTERNSAPDHRDL